MVCAQTTEGGKSGYILEKKMRNTYRSQDLKKRCTRNRRMLESVIQMYLGNLKTGPEGVE